MFIFIKKQKSPYTRIVINSRPKIYKSYNQAGGFLNQSKFSTGHKLGTPDIKFISSI